MLPFVEGRALTVERFPQGVGGKGFMQKNAPDHYPKDLIQRFEVPKEEGGTTVYPVIDSVDAVEFFANFGVITFHVPPVRAADETRPDWAIWDLDPPPGEVGLVRSAARAIRTVLERHGIATEPMTSGSKGYHLRAKLKPTVDIEDVGLMTRGIAALACEEHPDLMTLAFRKADRGDRVFVDWMRNTPRSTSVAPWSLRARPGAPVAPRSPGMSSIRSSPMEFGSARSKSGLRPIRGRIRNRSTSARPWPLSRPQWMTPESSWSPSTDSEADNYPRARCCSPSWSPSPRMSPRPVPGPARSSFSPPCFAD